MIDLTGTVLNPNTLSQFTVPTLTASSPLPPRLTAASHYLICSHVSVLQPPPAEGITCWVTKGQRVKYLALSVVPVQRRNVSNQVLLL